MLTLICQYLRNWFDRGKRKAEGKIAISDGSITCDGVVLPFLEGQCYRVIGSLLNDGVHVHPDDGLRDEEFEGAVWDMAVPPSVIELSTEISAWCDKYQSLDSPAMSPYQSESFGGYTYSKGAASTTDGGGQTWQEVFGKRLDPWRKI